MQASVGSHCVECARAAKPDVKTRARYWSARQPTLVTYTLIAINVAVFVWIGIQYPETIGGALPQTLDNPQFDIGLNNFFLEGGGEWYRLVTSGFLHFGIIHLGFNMLMLFQLGQLLEPEIGRIRFALLYFASLLAGSAAVVLLDPSGLTGGASGAVFGLMGAAFIGLRNRGINPFTTGLGTVLLLNLMLTFTLPGISIGGHIGGLIGGAIAGWVVLAPPYRRLPAWTTYAAPVAVILVSVAISVVSV